MTTHLNDSTSRHLTGEELLLHRILGSPSARGVIEAELDRRALHGFGGATDAVDTLASGQAGRFTRPAGFNVAA